MDSKSVRPIFHSPFVQLLFSGTIQSFRGLNFLRKMHQFEHQRILVRLERGEVLAGLDDHLGDAHLAVFLRASRNSAYALAPCFCGSR